MLKSMEYSVLIEDFWLPLKYAIIGSLITGIISISSVIVDHILHSNLLMVFEHAIEYEFYIPRQEIQRQNRERELVTKWHIQFCLPLRMFHK